jgi:hypothetical protein
MVKKKKPATLTVSRHRRPTSSVDRTSVHVPTMDRPNPDTNLSAAYAHTLDANAVSTPAKDMETSDTSSIFLRPRNVSASVASTNPPVRHPAKKDDAGRETSAGPAHLSAHSDTIDVSAGRSHAHAADGNAHGVAASGEQAEPSVQCQRGSASVNACCASKAHAKARKMALNSCILPVLPM